MVPPISRRQFAIAGAALGAGLAVPARGQGGIADELTRKLPPALRPLLAEVPGEAFEIVDTLRALERDADKLRLPASKLSPAMLLSLPPDPRRLYELALPRLVALVDRGEAGNLEFADRAGALLARLHARERSVPEALGGIREEPAAAGLVGRRTLLAMAGQVPGGPEFAEDAPQSITVPEALPEQATEQAPEKAEELPAVSRSLAFDSLRDEYAAYFAAAELRPGHRESADFHLAMLRQSRPRYAAIAKRAGVPWQFVGVIHGLETSFNFRAHLHNGDFPLTRRTRQVPAGRPTRWLPPSDWDSSALDALQLLGFSGQSDWSLPRMLYRFEAYNGFGYRRRGLISPYLWSFSNHYARGKFVADGRYDPSARSQQCGAAMMLRLLADAGDFEA